MHLPKKHQQLFCVFILFLSFKKTKQKTSVSAAVRETHHSHFIMAQKYKKSIRAYPTYLNLFGLGLVKKKTSYIYCVRKYEHSKS